MHVLQIQANVAQLINAIGIKHPTEYEWPLEQIFNALGMS